ncbi:MAG: chorismate-binding protein [Thermoanaerobaculia bacterium]
MKVALPHVREYLAETLTPLAAYERLATLSPVRFLFESVAGGERVSRYSFLGAGPREVLRLFADRLEIERDGAVRALPGAPLAALAQAVGGWTAPAAPVPFAGGFVGSFGFDLVRLLERLPGRPPDPWRLPIATLGRFDDVVAFDHARQRLLLIGNEIAGESERGEVERRLDRLEALLARGPAARPTRLPAALPALDREPAVSLAGGPFRAAVERAREHIAAGDIFQVVLARRFRLASAAPPIALYRALRSFNPSPYMVLLETPEATLVGASPEMLVKKRGARVVTRPIAGTRRRSADPEEDRRLGEELAADPKERAEHVMLVDLGRNDLGRVARAGSVEVPTFLEIERYSHVMHLVSSVEGELGDGHGALDALLACFPAGTVSGAPKVRAIEILDALEPEARGPYAGATGYLSFAGDLDTCITIRTLVVRGGEVSVTAGAGIVADSDPASEERETENKAAALLAAVALAERLAEAS